MRPSLPWLILFALLVPAAAAAEPLDIEKYYPIRPHVVRWYAVKDAQSGAPIDLISFAIVAREVSPGGHPVYLIENRYSGGDRYAGGVSIDYEEVSSDQVQLDRLVVVQNERLRDVRFTPALPLLRAPLEVGRTWSATPAGDQPYTYRVESRFSVNVLGKEVQDCVRVVRTRAETVDRKTEYCPGLGVAAFDMLWPSGIPGATWVRAELVAVTGETDLIAVKSNVRIPGGCEYIFDPLGSSRGELTATVLPPGLPPMTFQRPANENIHVGVPAGARRGQWRLEIKQPPRTAWQTFSWQGTCHADFLAPTPSLGPSLTLVREVAESGQVTLTVVGVGWPPGEPLTLTLAGPGWDTKTSPLGIANAGGVSPAAVVPIGDTLPKGEFTFTVRGATSSATLTVVCGDKRAQPLGGYCAVKFWRRVMTSPDARGAAEPK